MVGQNTTYWNPKFGGVQIPDFYLHQERTFGGPTKLRGPSKYCDTLITPGTIF